uniref:Fatty acyl-CoA reductase n=1 Tax=Timema cristinae TaxID=61476 RepID=A0A7R9DB69_TIMCR|nr:unnamed protein product [Timema cristinae]
MLQWSCSVQLFDRLKSEQDGVLSRKVVGVAGDVLISPDLGLSLADKELLCRDVSIVYHAAATIRFDEPLKRAVMLNTRGTRQMLELAKEMHKLEVTLFILLETMECNTSHVEKSYLARTGPDLSQIWGKSGQFQFWARSGLFSTWDIIMYMATYHHCCGDI